MAWCEAEGVDYLLGLAKNDRLKTEIQEPMKQAEALYRESGQAARVFHEFVYQTRESWSRARRVVAKAEYLEKGENPRFIVTSLGPELWPAQPLYEKHKAYLSLREQIACLRCGRVFPSPPTPDDQERYTNLCAMRQAHLHLCRCKRRNPSRQCRAGREFAELSPYG